MALYRFDHWEDELGATIGTALTLTQTITASKTFVAMYVLVTHTVTYQSNPIAVNSDIGPPGTQVQVDDGDTVTITVPQEVTI